MTRVFLDNFMIAIGGIIAVFLGLILIEIVIALFNRYFQGRQAPQSEISSSVPKLNEQPVDTIAEDVVIAIATAIECYRRIHFDNLPSQITFIHGNQQSAWKAGVNYSQRLTAVRKI